MSYLPQDQLVCRVRCGDSEAFGDLYEQYFNRLWAFAYRHVRSSDIAEDIVQDVFVRIWERRAQWIISTSVTAYLFAATRNQALQYLARLRDVSPDEEDEHRGDGFTSGVLASSPLERLQLAELEHQIATVIAALPERQRLAITLRIDQEMTQAEIADLLGISQPAVAKLLHKAEEHIREILRDD